MKKNSLRIAALGAAMMAMPLFNANAQWAGLNPITTSSSVGIGPATIPSSATLNPYLHISNNSTALTTRKKLTHWEWTSNSNFQLDIFGDNHATRPGFVQFGGWNTDVRLGFVVDSKTNVENGTSTSGLFINTQNAGLVGIGTTAPLAYLDVVSPTVNALRLQNTSTTPGSNVGIDFYAGGANSSVAKARILAVDVPVTGSSVGNSALAFYTRPNTGGNALERMRIAESGLVGIGTTAPAATLDLYDAAGASLLVGGFNPLVPAETFRTSLSIAGCSGCHSLVATQGDAVLRAVNGGKNLIIANNGGAGSIAGEILFVTGPSAGALEQTRMKIGATGKVSIGNPSLFTNGLPGNYKLYVSDGILTEKLKVAVKTTSDWSDYVFDKNYELKSLEEVKSYIEENNHLPDVPSSQEVVNNGIDVATMDATLLRKIEELTLYMLQQQKEIEELKKQLNK